MRRPCPARHLLVLVNCVLLALATSTVSASSDMLINNSRLISSLTGLTSSTQTTSGCWDSAAYSATNRRALRQLARLMQNAGMMTHVDAAGNLVGRLQGKHAWPSLVMGSHIDTVAAGGRCDGLAGAMAAIEVARTLHDNGTVLQHPLEIIIWADSEGSLLGSRSVYERIEAATIHSRFHGSASIAEGIIVLGGDPHGIAHNQRLPGTMAAYLEIQVEPGANRDSDNADLRFVRRFPGIRRWQVQISSIANNAGMSEQNDSELNAATRLMTAVSGSGEPQPDHAAAELYLVAPTSTAAAKETMGTLLRLDIQADNMQGIDRLFAAVRKRTERIGEETGTRFTLEPVFELPPASPDQQIAKTMGAAANDLQLSFTHQRGYAGFDAQRLSSLTAVALIIVPGNAQDSVSRSRVAQPDALVNGTNVLLRTLIKLDRQRHERSR